MARINRRIRTLLDRLLVPFTWLAARWFRAVRRYGVHRMPWSLRVFRGVGVFPIRDHFYEPLFQPSRLRAPLDAVRALPGIDFNDEEQLALLASLRYCEEVRSLPRTGSRPGRFALDSPSFGLVDAQFLHQMVRRFRPARLIEIGSGDSTLVSLAAARRNAAEDPAAVCRITCIEPHPPAWLRELPLRLVSSQVELVGAEPFAALEENDILFIDSTHMVRPQGDVLFEVLELLPTLRPGVLVHVHDIFTPRDYPSAWVRDEVRLWNEQYLLEALLTDNPNFRILGAVNYLRHRYPDRLAARCPALLDAPQSEPGSFWFVRSGSGATRARMRSRNSRARRDGRSTPKSSA